MIDVLDYKYETSEWRLFIDYSQNSLTTDLLYNENDFPFVPIAYATKMKKTYQNIMILLKTVEYKKHC